MKNAGVVILGGSAAGVTAALTARRHDPEKSVMLGGQVHGNSAAGELLNVMAACVQQRMHAEDIAMFQMGTHPALTASPVAYPFTNGAEIAIGAMRNRS